jgi:hypothetical protein
MERARASLERVRAINAQIPERDEKLEALLARTGQHRVEAAAALASVQEALPKSEATLAPLRALRAEAAEIAKSKLANLRDVAEKARAAADELPDEQDMVQFEAHAGKIAKIAGTLLVAPLSEDAQRVRDRLLVISAIVLLVSFGLVTLQTLEMVVHVKFVDSKIAWLIVAAGLACLYFLITFLAAYVRDLRVSEVVRANSVLEIRLTWKQILDGYAYHLAEHTQEIARLQDPDQGPAELMADLDRITKGERRLQMLTDEVNVVCTLLRRANSLPRLRLWAEVLLPSAIAVVALGGCVWFAWRLLLHTT